MSGGGSVGDSLLERFGRQYQAGTVLFREGDAGAEMYVIHAGRVELTRQFRDRTTVLAVLPAGEFFGEMSIVNNKPRSATATVLEDSTLIVIDPRTFEAMIRGKAEIAVRMIRTLAGRLEQANQQIELLLLKDSNHRVVQCLRRLAEQQGYLIQGSSAVYIAVTVSALAGRVALDDEQVIEVLERLETARLIMPAAHAGIEGEGYVVPEVGRLVDFLEFLDMKERFGAL
jgi:CRP/FNR family transcriptional regulator, cyclic AMP receptor protein